MTIHQIPDTIGELLNRTDSADGERHYCQTDDGTMVFVMGHPLHDMTEPGVDPFITYGVFRCLICGDWWGNWLFRDIAHDRSDWYRFGPDSPICRHREISEEEM